MSVAAVAVVLLSLDGCRKAATAESAPRTLVVTSADIQQGTEIPKQFTCDGEGVSPALGWDQPPAGTRSMVVIVSDPDAPSGTFIHWVIYNLSAETRGLARGVVAKEMLPDGSRQGVNSGDKVGYYGPCPPGHSQHRYFFTVYALDQVLALPSGADESQVSKAMHGHVLAQGQLMGKYGR
ncbi:UPF0098 protein [Edaphobacter acidisoli]|uniref:UPF0098 protein n=1 Tax=Edaphobacter acidisoli TaxID=2040573 RepID=A0A916RUT0_9BACT|nr:YbhB/YbcL family Raf kinase inhibitor-like protein [Edaphobacter acidisoli]GGA71322.1 UPF0098 protein [Edaphobacter acidisoli]